MPTGYVVYTAGLAYDPSEVYPGGESYRVFAGEGGAGDDVLYASYGFDDKVANFHGSRSMPIFNVRFENVFARQGAFPDLAAFNGKSGSFSLDEVRGFPDSDEVLLSGGTGRVTVQGIAAVPEPAAWAMMLIGFGAVGGTMRRRTSKVTTRVAFV